MADTWEEGKLLRSFYIDRYENSRSLGSSNKINGAWQTSREAHDSLTLSLPSFSLFLSSLPFHDFCLSNSTLRFSHCVFSVYVCARAQTRSVSVI